MQEKEKTRQSNFEILRILSILMIVAFHYVINSEYDLTVPFSFNKLTVDIVYHFGEIGVNCFILISGYFLKETKFKIKKLISIVITCELYVILGRVIAHLCGVTPLSDYTFKDYLFPILMVRYWFVTIYVFIYMLSPFLKKLTEALSQKEFAILLIGNYIVWSVFQTYALGYMYGRTEAETMDNYSRFVWLLVVYLTGAYLRQYGLPKLNTLKSRVILLILTCGFIMLHVVMAEKGVPFLLPATFYWSPNTPPLFILSVALFSVFELIKVPYIKVINYLASCTLGIYMIHERAMADVWWKYVFKTNEAVYSSRLIPWVLIATIVIFAAGVITESIRKAIFALFIRREK